MVARDKLNLVVPCTFLIMSASLKSEPELQLLQSGLGPGLHWGGGVGWWGRSVDCASEARTLGSAVVSETPLKGKQRSREERLGVVPEIHTLHPGQSLPCPPWGNLGWI